FTVTGVTCVGATRIAGIGNPNILHFVTPPGRGDGDVAGDNRPEARRARPREPDLLGGGEAPLRVGASAGIPTRSRASRPACPKRCRTFRRPNCHSDGTAPKKRVRRAAVGRPRTKERGAGPPESRATRAGCAWPLIPLFFPEDSAMSQQQPEPREVVLINVVEATILKTTYGDS